MSNRVINVPAGVLQASAELLAAFADRYSNTKKAFEVQRAETEKAAAAIYDILADNDFIDDGTDRDEILSKFASDFSGTAADVVASLANQVNALAAQVAAIKSSSADCVQSIGEVEPEKQAGSVGDTDEAVEAFQAKLAAISC